MTILRSKETRRQDFIFFMDRLSTLLVEHALQHLPYTPKEVITPIGAEAQGKTIDAQVRETFVPFKQWLNTFNPNPLSLFVEFPSSAREWRSPHLWS